jgi:hypothetical protein
VGGLNALIHGLPKEADQRVTTSPLSGGVLGGGFRSFVACS